MILTLICPFHLYSVGLIGFIGSDGVDGIRMDTDPFASPMSPDVDPLAIGKYNLFLFVLLYLFIFK